MKKRDFLFAGLLLFAAVPMNAQELVPEGPTRTANDPQELFFQGFESDWESWIAKEVDRIDTLFYYDHWGDSGVSNITDSVKNWSKKPFIVRTDSVLILQNGVVTTDDAKDGGLNGAAFAKDKYDILEDQAGSSRRAELQETFGIEPGTHYFQYASDKKLINNSGLSWQIAYENGVAAEYRRNLFVRGLPIENNSSYRLTMYVKLAQSPVTITPTLNVDLMRGYFHSEKPLSNGLTTFSETKTKFTGNWEKVTLMSYYANPEINEQAYNKEYYWSTDWNWKPAGSTESDYLRFIKQPDKFFARFAFRSDSTIFQVDNISLTKSYIGGVEYYNNMVRVDFGYQTNLGELAEKALAETKIDAVELPGDYFTVLGYYSGEGNPEDAGWFKVGINSAEYHGDGYMYMWTAEDEEGSSLTFDYYDTVLVSFKNPIDRSDLCLHYTDAQKFPMADNKDWVDAGKLVPDFTNEPATLNPFVFDGVVSMKDRAPVIQEESIEAGSFNLDGDIREITFSFSKAPVVVLNVENPTIVEQNSAIMQVTKDGVIEYWYPSAVNADKTKVTFKRGSAYTSKLEGDYVFTVSNVESKTGRKAEAPTVMYYSFGPSPLPENLISYIDFDNFATGSKFEDAVAVPGFSLEKAVAKVADFKGTVKKALMFGIYSIDTKAENNAQNCAKLFYEVNIPADGNYDFELGASGCQKGSYNDGAKMVIFLYDAEGNEAAQLQAGETQNRPDEGGVINAVDTLRFTANGLKQGTYKMALTLPNEGSYGGSHKGGRVLYYVMITEAGQTVTKGLSFKPQIGYKNAIEALNKSLAQAKANLNVYGGSVYEAQVPVAAKYAAFTHTAPSKYAIVTDSLNAANALLLARFAVVDAMLNADALADTAATKFNKADESNKTVAAYIALADLLKFVDEFICKNAEVDSIKALQSKLEKATTALNDREKIMNDFTTELANALAKLASASAGDSTMTVFAALQKVYDERKVTDKYLGSDSLITAATKALQDAENVLNSRQDLIAAFVTELNTAKDYLDKASQDQATMAVYAALQQIYGVADAVQYFSVADSVITAETANVKDANGKYQARLDLIAAYDAQITNASALIKAAEASTFPEYATLQQVLDEKGAINEYTVADEELTAATAALKTAADNYSNSLAIIPLATARLKGLKATLEALEGTKYFGAGADELAERVGAASTDDPVLVDVYKSAIRMAIYDKYKDAAAEEAIDLSSFIANAGLYCDAEINSDFVKTSVQTGWGWPATYTDYYTVKRNNTTTTVFPGWKLTTGGGQFYLGNYVKLQEAEIVNKPRFSDSWVAFDWSTSFSMEQDVVGLPEGEYSLGAWAAFGVANKSFLFAGSAQKDFNNGDGSEPQTPAATPNIWMDPVSVTAGDTLKIGAKSDGQNSWGYVDNYSFKFTPKNDNYATLLEAEHQALNAKLTELIDFVDDKAADVQVSYYGVDGVQVAAPQAKKVTIKVSKKANGARVIEKVLTK